MKLSIREALESSCPAQERNRGAQYRGESSLSNSRELKAHRDLILRFINELEEDGDMTVDDLRLHLEDWP